MDVDLDGADIACVAAPAVRLAHLLADVLVLHHQLGARAPRVLWSQAPCLRAYAKIMCAGAKTEVYQRKGIHRTIEFVCAGAETEIYQKMLFMEQLTGRKQFVVCS